MYICYSTGDWFNTALSGFITSTCVQYYSKPSTNLVSIYVWYKLFVYWRYTTL